MNSRKKGKQFEEHIALRLKCVTGDESIRPTKASSGGVRNTEIGDILCKDFFIEAKNHTKATVSLKVWDKLLNSIPMNSAKIPLYIIKRPNGEELITLKFDDFLKFLTLICKS
jgi:hypothetical protein